MSDRSPQSVRDASYYDRIGPARLISDAERALVAKLIKDTPYEDEILKQLGHILVRNMPDGGMGSIKFDHGSSRQSTYDEQIAEGAFRDRDGTPVSVTLSLDDSGRLFELDMFKADGSPLISYPEPGQFEVVERHGKLGWSLP